MISFKNVFVKYTKEFYALSNINLEAKEGEKIALVGPKGSGKTCIIRLLAGLDKLTKGEIYINDIPIGKVDFLRDISMGYIPFHPVFFDRKSVLDNLKYVLDVRKTKEGTSQEKLNKAVMDFRLESIALEKIYKLSIFQKYVVSVARLSFRKLGYLLIDDIFENLNPKETKELVRLIKKYLINEDTIVFFSTTNEEIAKSLATKIVYLKYGAIDKVC